jgi:hypothetical protein
MKAGKLTPASYRKLDLKKLAAMKPEALAVTFETLDALEPNIVPGQFGSTVASSLTDMRAAMGDDNFKRLKAEATDDIERMLGRKLKGSKKLAAGAPETSNMAEVDRQVEARMAAKREGAPDADKSLAASKHLAAIDQCLEKGDVEGAKKGSAELKKCGLGGSYTGGDLVAEGLEKVLSEQQMAIDQLHIQLAKLNDALKLMLAAEEAEEQEMAGDPEDPSEQAAGDGEAAAEPGADGGAGKPAPKKAAAEAADGGEKKPPAKEGGDAPPPKKEGEEKPAPAKDEDKK